MIGTSFIARFRGQGASATLVRGAGGAFMVNVLGTGLMFGAHIVLARTMGASSYGNYAYALTWLSILMLFGKLGLDTASLRFVAQYNGTGKWGLLKGFIQKSSLFALTASITIALITALILWVLREKLNSELLRTFWVACLVLPLYSFLLVRSAALRGLKKVIQAQSAVKIFRPAILVLIIAGLILFLGQKRTLDAPGAMAIEVVAFTVSLIFVIICFKRAKPPETADAKSEYITATWLRVALPMLLISAVMQTQNQVDVLLVGFFVDPDQVGMYAAAKKATLLIAFGLTAINVIAAPIIAELWHEKRKQELQRILSLAARCIFAYTLPVSLIMIIFGRQILTLFGDEFTAAYGALVILSIGQIVNALSGSVGIIMNMTGYQNKLAFMVIACVSLNIILSIVLIPYFGIYGAALSISISLIAWNILMFAYVFKVLKLNPCILSLGKLK